MSINWTKQTISDLRDHERRKQGLESMRERLAALEYQKQSFRSSGADSTPVQGGGNRYEDRLLDLISEQNRIELSIKATEILVNRVEKGLATLDEKERKVLDRFFVSRPKRYIDLLIEEVDREQSTIYEIKDRALYKLTLSMCGVVNM